MILKWWGLSNDFFPYWHFQPFKLMKIHLQCFVGNCNFEFNVCFSKMTICRVQFVNTDTANSTPSSSSSFSSFCYWCSIKCHINVRTCVCPKIWNLIAYNFNETADKTRDSNRNDVMNNSQLCNLSFKNVNNWIDLEIERWQNYIMRIKWLQNTLKPVDMISKFGWKLYPRNTILFLIILRNFFLNRKLTTVIGMQSPTISIR